MTHPLASLPSQVPSFRSVANFAVQLAVSCLLLAAFCDLCSAQNVQGLPTVGNGSGTVPSSSQMLIDVTQFGVSTDDMCKKIALACAKLGTTGYPLGATIDARGFTGNQVCSALTITKMLFQCSPQGSSTGATGGKLLLGEVNLYADGPASGNYTDGTSGIGTPALLIPSNFWGIEGISRGATPGTSAPGTGTFLSVCTGSGTPVTGCTTAFPQRSFPITSASVSGNTMTITLGTTVTKYTNIYPAELVMVKDSSTTNQNGTYKIQSITNGTGSGSITVTVPTGTGSCSSPTNCGTVFLGTPILGFASTSKAYNDASCFTGTPICSGFGEHIRNLGFNCQGGSGLQGCIGWQNLYAEEQSGADTYNVNFYNFVGVDIHGGPQKTSQNFGPVLNGEIYTGVNNASCSFGTIGVYLGDATMRGLNGWTIINSGETGSSPTCASTPIAAVLFDAPSTEISSGHCEGFANCVLMGANNQPTSSNAGASSQKVSGVVGGPPCAPGPCNVVHISNNYPNNTDYLIENIRRNQFTNNIQDDVNGITLGSAGNDGFTAIYSWASGINNTSTTINNSTSTSATNLITSDPSTRNRFDSGIRTATIESGVTTNTDLAGQCTVGATNCPTISLTQTYTSAPICTCSDTSGVNACRVQVTVGTPTTLVISGTGSHTINYICIGRN